MFKPIIKGKDKGKYRSPEGRVFTEKQVNLYHVTDGFKDKRKLAEYRLGSAMRKVNGL